MKTLLTILFSALTLSAQTTPITITLNMPNGVLQDILRWRVLQTTCTTTLTSAVNNSTTAIPLDNCLGSIVVGTHLYIGGQWAAAGSENCTVTAVGGAGVTCTRGTFTTSAEAHAMGDSVVVLRFGTQNAVMQELLRPGVRRAIQESNSAAIVALRNAISAANDALAAYLEGAIQ